MIRFTDEERPIGIQIFGDEPEVMANAARFVADQFKPDIIDINYGCPVPKITKRGAGSAALKDLCLMEEITSAVVESVPQLPVTVKMRAGWDSQRIIVEKAGNQLEKAGVKAITLHPRTTKQYFTGKADWSLIKILKQAVSIPVVGNGDIGTADDVKRMFEETGCDAVMIGRAALGNPWIFGEIKSIFEKTALPPAPLVEDRISTCRRHLNLLVENRGERVGLNLMRKHFGWYIKNFPGAGEFRKELVTSPDSKTALEKLDKLAVVQL
jgi:tRNA-dihydrouridine synthase B